MRIGVLSDLHLEFEHFEPAELDVDLVVLAGDIHTKERGIRWANEVFSSEVLYVLGNHEFYSGHFDRTLEKSKQLAASHVHVLEQDVFIRDGIRFLGCTGWTDFRATGDVTAASAKAMSSMTDFKVIRAGENYRRLRPDDVASRSRQAKAWLTTELEKPFTGRTVVITHHSPLIEVGGHEQDGHLTASYCNSWPSLVMKADVWVFGHTHHAIDIEMGGCRLISNPKGYPLEQTGFDASKVVEI
ncbi:metallophosphoesterase family protein [Pseudomonas sp. S07E 245]|uniref:metallophosphoesterase family protein n=1 Tax=Pseudomonas sp. S07E 245 TaxID=2866278 RepID=UPI001C72DE95|nr:metallophosphoesterase [Pseudomonas sp. S07E 245]QYX50462.1 metallophosphoesterase family protein [Pseudomonas sp. S07E 245]